MDELTAQRLAKLDQLRSLGIDPYPARVQRSHSAAGAVAIVDALAEGQSDSGELVQVAGRVVAKRDQGKVTFLDLQDASGRVQVMLRVNQVGEAASVSRPDGRKRC